MHFEDNDSKNLFVFRYEYGYCTTESNVTPYGEQCSDECAQRGYPYYWCHKSVTLWGYCTPQNLIDRTKKWDAIFGGSNEENENEQKDNYNELFLQKLMSIYVPYHLW